MARVGMRSPDLIPLAPATLLYHVKAEAVIAMLLAVRHRTVALVGTLTAVVVAVVYWQDAGDDLARAVVSMMLGVLTAVAASRAFAGGGARESAWSAPGTRMVVAFGRWFGCMTILVPVAALASAIVGQDAGSAQFGVALVRLLVQLAGLTGFSMLAASFIGASGGAGLGMGLALWGGLPPEAYATLFGEGLIADVTVHVWRSLPLQWRAAGTPRDLESLAVSAVWVGLLMAIIPVAVRHDA